MKLCKIKNCEHISWAKGMCRIHYAKQGKIIANTKVPEIARSKASIEMWKKVRELQKGNVK